jgi:hypothetical protein
MKKLISALAVATTLTVATAAQANGIYLGFDLGFVKAKSQAGGPAGQYGYGASELKAPIVGFTAGYRWDLNSGFAAAELNGDFSTRSDFKNTVSEKTCPESGSTGAYYCSHNSTFRLRGIYGVPVENNWELYGALGVGAMTGDGATSVNTVDKGVNVGVSVGFGVQRKMERGKFRFEYVHDNFNNTRTNPTYTGGGVPIKFEPSYKANTLMASYILGF